MLTDGTNAHSAPAIFGCLTRMRAFRLRLSHPIGMTDTA